MPNKITRILYDVSQAIDQLKNLDKQTGKTGKNTKKSFDDAEKGVNKYTRALDKLNPRAGKAASIAVRLGGSFGPMGVAAGGAAVAIGSLVSAMGGLPDVMRNNIEQIDKFLDRADKLIATRDRLSAADDARTRRQFRDRRDELETERSSANLRKVELRKELKVAEEALNVRKDTYKKIEAELKKSVDRRKSIEDKLKDARLDAEVTATGAGKTAGGRLVDLTFRAEQEARKGNLELAQKLTDEASNLLDETGNHFFFTSKIADANQAISDKMKEQVKDSKTREGGLKRQLNTLEQIVDKEQKRVDLLKKDVAKEELTVAEIEPRLTKLNIAERFQADAEGADRARDSLIEYQNALRAVLSEGRSGFTNLGTILGGFSDIIDPRRSAESAGEDFSFVKGLQGEIVDAIREGFKDGGLSSDDIKAIAETAQSAEKRLTTRQAAGVGGELGNVANVEVAFLERLIKLTTGGITQARTEAEKAGIDPTKPIIIEADKIEAKAAQLTAEAINPTKTTGGQTPQQQPAQPAPNQGASTTNTYNFKIEGGMLDEATMSQIEDRFRRLIREEKSQGVA